jgi:hypothetical protein
MLTSHRGWTPTTPFATMQSQADILTNTYMPILRTVAGDGYAYMNEVKIFRSEHQIFQ